MLGADAFSRYGIDATVRAVDLNDAAITDVRVIDRGVAFESTTVVVAAGTIVEVTAGAPNRPVARTLDGRGATLLAGLIDTHTHVEAGRLEQALAFGVTTEIDMFNDPEMVARLREQAAVRDDLADLHSAGTGATAPNGHPGHAVDRGLVPPFPTVSGPEDVEAFVAARVAEGSDLLKIFVEPGMLEPVPALSESTVSALAAAAREAGLRSVAHATDVASARVAVRAGVDVLGHVFCDRYDPEFATFAAVHRVAVIPTLCMLETLCERSHAAQLAADPWVAARLDDVSRATLGARWPVASTHRDYEVARATVRDLYDAGVTIMAGSDAVTPGTAHGASLHRELELLVDAGLSPASALRAATDWAAAVFGLTDRGRVAPGYRADLVLLDGNPLADIGATRRIRAVWRRGSAADRFDSVGA